MIISDCLVHEDCEETEFCSPPPDNTCVDACTLDGEDSTLHTLQHNTDCLFQCAAYRQFVQQLYTGQCALVLMGLMEMLMINVLR